MLYSLQDWSLNLNRLCLSYSVLFCLEFGGYKKEGILGGGGSCNNIFNVYSCNTNRLNSTQTGRIKRRAFDQNNLVLICQWFIDILKIHIANHIDIKG